jgi:hypothetical protein
MIRDEQTRSRLQYVRIRHERLGCTTDVVALLPQDDRQSFSDERFVIYDKNVHGAVSEMTS